MLWSFDMPKSRVVFAALYEEYWRWIVNLLGLREQLDNGYSSTLRRERGGNRIMWLIICCWDVSQSVFTWDIIVGLPIGTSIIFWRLPNRQGSFLNSPQLASNERYKNYDELGDFRSECIPEKFWVYDWFICKSSYATKNYEGTAIHTRTHIAFHLRSGDIVCATIGIVRGSRVLIRCRESRWIPCEMFRTHG